MMMSDISANPAEGSEIPSAPILEARGLTCGHGSGSAYRPVLSGFNIKVEEREIVCLLGASGCGKSTFLGVVAGLQAHQGGEIRFRGRKLGGPDPGIGFVFQHPVLLPWFNVHWNIAWSLRLKHSGRLSASERRDRVSRELAAVELADSGRLWPYQLSGGMAQRVALARALARDPGLLLLDEPFSALDAITRLEMQRLLLDLVRSRNFSVVLVTHDIDEAILLGDRVILLGGSPASILREWSIPESRPRFETAERLIPLRCEILAALSRSLSKNST